MCHSQISKTMRPELSQQLNFGFGGKSAQEAGAREGETYEF